VMPVSIEPVPMIVDFMENALMDNVSVTKE
jgi:hypothetical protein